MASARPRVAIKPFRHQTKLERPQQDTWMLLKNAIEQIFTRKAETLSYEELYRSAYNMVLNKYGEKLYRGLQEVISEHFDKVYASLKDKKDILKAVDTTWQESQVSIIMIRNILLYMDRMYVPQNNLMHVYDLCLETFRTRVILREPIRTSLLETFFCMVSREREGETIDRVLMKNISTMFVDLGTNSQNMYEETLERPFLEISRNYYKQEAEFYISQYDCSQFLKRVEMRLKEERCRVQSYFDSQTEAKIIDVVKDTLIASHLKALFEMEGNEVCLLRDDRIDDLRRMYTLFKLVSRGHLMMKNTMSNYLKKCGYEIVNTEEYKGKDNTYIPALLKLKAKFDYILEHAFENNSDFHHALNQAFEYILNLDSHAPEYLSLYIDELLRKGFKEIGEVEVDKILDNVMALFRFIQEKDVFERYYKQHLAKRLLSNRVGSEIEKGVISRLKNECGYQFTSKLEGMFNDINTSCDTTAVFKNYLEKSGKTPLLNGIDLNVHVLTMGFWPMHLVYARCIVPAELEICCNTFNQFYYDNHTGRRLSWIMHMGTADLRAHFDARRHELSVLTIQMCILLLFNRHDTLTLPEIQDSVGLSGSELSRHLATLSHSRHRVLIKEEPADGPTRYTFNSKFKHKLHCVKIMHVMKKETDSEREITKKSVEEDRNFLIEAAIVRTIKMRKSIEHNHLVLEVTRQLSSRFRPNPALIKKRIELLIEREYMERSPQDKNVYIYLA
ncbi:cullin-3-like [Schistocerca gregaria]|uniref:cullin-3-like n=1 Tax=Schistocerca gregaria TaxID=7010 RepID=UPI00211EEF67|nr:cullin-3-like [Schistocerca gregaria]